jgi:hypothetical protein
MMPAHGRPVTDGSSSRFSAGGFVLALVTVGAATAAGLAVDLVAGSYIGILLGGLLAGVATERRPVLEAGVAAVLANLGVLVAGSLVGNGIVAVASAFGSLAPTTLLASTVLGFAVGAFGAHFGDDIRDGLTTPVEEPSSGSTGSGSPARTARTDASALEDAGVELENADAGVESEADGPATPGDDASAPRDRPSARGGRDPGPDGSDTSAEEATGDVELERE